MDPVVKNSIAILESLNLKFFMKINIVPITNILLKGHINNAIFY